ncbi:hypothetical protein ES703_35369 [subsurface metagenome]
MNRLRSREENVIGHIHYVVDGVETHDFDLLLQPFGRWTDFNSFHHYSAVTGAEVRIPDLNITQLGGLFLDLGQRPLLLLQLQPEYRSNFPRHSQVAERVRTVGIGLDVQDNV